MNMIYVYEFRSGISNYIIKFLFDVNTYSGPEFILRLTKPPLQLVCVRVITAQRQLRRYLFIHDIISDELCF